MIVPSHQYRITGIIIMHSILFVVVIFSTWLFMDAYKSCRCETKGLEYNFCKAEYVLRVRIVSDAVSEQGNSEGKKFPIEIYSILKGDQEKVFTLDLDHIYAPQSCGFPFVAYEDYTVFAESKDGKLYAGLCSGTVQASQALEAQLGSVECK